MREHTNIKIRQMLAEEIDDKLRDAEKAFNDADTPRHRAAYIRQLNRAGRHDEANTIEGTGIINELVSGVNWNKPDAAEIARLVAFYTPAEMRELLASNTPNRLNLIGHDKGVYHRTDTKANGEPRHYRTMSKLHTWKTQRRTGEFRISILYGGYRPDSDSGYLTQDNADEFMIDADGP